MRERHLLDALAMTGQFYGAEIDIDGHVRPPRSIEEGVACRVRTPDDAQSSRGAVAPVRDPFVEHDTIPNIVLATALNVRVDMRRGKVPGQTDAADVRSSSAGRKMYAIFIHFNIRASRYHINLGETTTPPRNACSLRPCFGFFPPGAFCDQINGEGLHERLSLLQIRRLEAFRELAVD